MKRPKIINPEQLHAMVGYVSNYCGCCRKTFRLKRGSAKKREGKSKLEDEGEIESEQNGEETKLLTHGINSKTSS